MPLRHSEDDDDNDYQCRRISEKILLKTDKTNNLQVN